MPQIVKHYYLSQWVWDTSTNFNCWKAPDNVTGSIDLRNKSECGKSGGSPDAKAKGFFTTVSADSNLDLYLGNSLSANVLPGLRRNVETVLGLSAGSITANVLNELLAQVLTELGDARGVDRWRPLTSNAIYLSSNLKIWQGNWRNNRIWRKKFLETKQCDYRHICKEIKEGFCHPDHHRKMLDYWSERYNLDHQLFIPADMPKEKPLPHETTKGDTFVEAVDTAIGAHTATGPNGGFSWAVINGSGTVRAATDDLSTTTSGGENNFRAEIDVTGDDHYVEAFITFPVGSSRDARVYTRFSSSVWEGYLLLSNSAGSTLLFKVISGSGTLIIDYNDTLGAPNNRQFRLESNGSTHTPTVGGSVLASQTDTTFTGQTRGGVGGWSNVTTIDNYEIADLTTGGIVVNPASVSSVSNVGNLSIAANANIAAIGNNSQSAAGILSTAGSSNVTALSAFSAGGVGNLSTANTALAAPVGATSSAEIGSLSSSGSALVIVQNVTASSSIGMLVVAAEAEISIIGTDSTGQPGTITTSMPNNVAVPISGISADAQAGTITVNLSKTVTFTGVNANGQTSNLTINAGAILLITGAASIASNGIVTVQQAPSSITCLDAKITITPVVDGVITIKPQPK